MVDWINNVPPAELAVELMAAFGPDGIRSGDRLGSSDLTDWMFRGYPKQTGLIVAARPVERPILEAVQLLEHSELIYLRWIFNDLPVWSVTRLGAATTVGGKDVIRRRILDRTGL
jgi:hypothetical protein